MTPTQRSLKFLRDAGYTVGITEKYNAYAKVRIDLYGAIDMLAIKEGEILGVQTTSDAHVADHVAKILAEPRILLWLQAGGRMVVHGWGKKGPRGKRKMWVCRQVSIIEEDFQS